MRGQRGYLRSDFVSPRGWKEARLRRVPPHIDGDWRGRHPAPGRPEGINVLRLASHHECRKDDDLNNRVFQPLKLRGTDCSLTHTKMLRVDQIDFTPLSEDPIPPAGLFKWQQRLALHLAQVVHGYM